MLIGRATNGFINPAGAVFEAVGAVIIPLGGETFVPTGISLNSDLAAGVFAGAAVQESIDTGATFTTIGSWWLRAAGSLDVSDGRNIAFSPANRRQALGSTALQYRFAAIHPGGAANTYSANGRGRTEK